STDHRYQSELYARGRDDLFFFFQAEDGIRDFHVTGVQTCALPISPSWPSGEVRNLASSAASSGCSLCVGTARNDPPQLPPPPGTAATSHRPSPASPAVFSMCPSIQAGQGMVANALSWMAAFHSSDQMGSAAERPVMEVTVS